MRISDWSSDVCSSDLHYKGLVQFLRQRTVTEQDAEDAAQESLARLLRYRESEPARAWKPLLFRIATNVAHDHLRQTRTQRHKAHVSLEEQDLSAIGESNDHNPEPDRADRRQNWKQPRTGKDELD